MGSSYEEVFELSRTRSEEGVGMYEAAIGITAE
jgi:hypothetical protein